MASFLNKLAEWMQNKGTDILAAIVALLVGLLIIRFFSAAIKAALRKTKLDGATASFIQSIFMFIMYMALLFIVVGILKINTTSFIAVVGAAGLAIGLALQDSLKNFANGIVLIFTKPFKKGDFVEIGTISGNVREIKLLTTELLSIDNKKIVLTNSNVINTNIINHSNRPTRRLDMRFLVHYESDMTLVKSVLLSIATVHTKILKTPEPLVRMVEHGESGIVFLFRVWVENKDYWDTLYEINEIVFAEFQKNGIIIPYKQIDINVRDSKEDNSDEK